MNNKVVLESLAMDLYRVALGHQRNSLKMAQRFYEEALLRISEIDITKVHPYIRTILSNVKELQNTASSRQGEDALMYSTLIQNYTNFFYHSQE